MAEEKFYLTKEQRAEDPGTTKRIQTDKLERQKQEDKQQTQRIEQEKNKQPLKKAE